MSDNLTKKENAEKQKLFNKYNGLSGTRLCAAYRSMIRRCYNENDKSYSDYGARGIIVCDEWLNDFQAFYDWAMENSYRDDLTIDRIDNNKGYSPDNCRWITNREQQRNKRSNVYIFYNGKNMLLTDVAKEIGVAVGAICTRIKNGKDPTLPKFVWEKPVIRDDGEIYKSVREASKKNGVSESKISMVCNGKRKRTAGHSFKFLTKEAAEAKLREMEGNA